jgi:preprotein translocase subunit SecE
MSANVDSAGFRFDGLKWLVVAGVIGGGVFANSYYQDDFNLLVRVLALVALGILAAFVAVNTAKGNAFWRLLKEAQVEVRKVVWPSNAETNQTTLLVSVVVVIAAVILWFLDWIIGQLAKLFIG